MCNCAVSKRSIFGGLATLVFLNIVGTNADIANRSPPNVTSTIVDTVKSSQEPEILVPVSPAAASQPVPMNKPKPPECFSYFPGTLQWDECFRRFHQNMANYQEKMQQFVKDQSAKIDGGSYTNGDSPNTRIGPGGYYSAGSSYFNTNSMSTSNSFTGGYAIRAVNMAMSTSLINNILKVTLHTGPIDKFDTRTNGNEITLSVVSKGQRKWALITVPQGIRISDVRVERSSDSIYLTGPTAINTGGNFQVSQSESSNSAWNTGSFNQNFGQIPGGNIPSIPMPEFQNVFQNMFQNIFSNMFGMGGRTYPNNKNSAATSSYASAGGPTMWFF